jgi:predicted DNA-binding transcriptional regulator YafY
MNADLVNFLQSNKEKAFKAQVINHHIGGNARSLRHDVNELRKAGVPIISGDFGYMYTEDVQKIDRCLERLASTSNNIFKVIMALTSTKTKILRGDSNGPLFDGSH